MAPRNFESAPAHGTWEIRYQLPDDAEPVTETVLTKQQARDRYFTVKEFKGVRFVELRGPGGKVWFRDHFFPRESAP